MAITTIQSAGSLYEGTSSAETIRFDTGLAAVRSSVNGAGGNDSLILTNLQQGITSTTLNGGIGDDSINVASDAFALADATILGDTGADSIYLSGGSLVNTEVKGGEGNDIINVTGYSSLSGGTVINAGGGDDSMTFGVVGATGTNIQAGAGRDTMDFGMGAGVAVLGSTAISVLGGGGNDEVNISGAIGSFSTINSDSSVDGGGNDTITINGDITTATSVLGKGGADQLILSGTVNSAAFINAGSGGDTIILSGVLDSAATMLAADGSDQIEFQGFSGSNAFLGAGAGADTIDAGNFVSGALAAGASNGLSSNTIQAGGGTDEISLSVQTGAVDATGTSIFGGAGADTIELGAASRSGAAFSGFSIGFSSMDESSLLEMDKVSGSTNVSGVNFSFDTAAGVTSFTIGVYTDSDVSTPSVTAGHASAESFTSADATVTSRVEDLDGILSMKGTLVSFEAGGEDYIFIQGGAAGVADDTVIEVSEEVSGFQVENLTFYANFDN